MLSSIRSRSPHQSMVERRFGASPSDPVARVEWLERKCRAMRAQGLAGHWAYDLALFVNTHFNAARRALGLPYWSFSAWAKLKVKNAVNFIGSFEQELAAEAKKRGVDGVVCGHIHHPIIRNMEGVVYVNTGDFVESCSLVVEHYDGRFEIVAWADLKSLTAGAANAYPDRDRRLAPAS